MICETHSVNIDIDFVKKFYSNLGDDLSRKIFKARLVYGFTGDASDLIGDDPVNEERKIINAFLNNSSAKYYMWGSGQNAKWMRNWMVRSFPNLTFVAYIDRAPKQKELFGTKVISAEDFFSRIMKMAS